MTGIEGRVLIDADRSLENGIDPAGSLDRALEGDQSLQRALELAYRYLSRRDRTTAEMRSHLTPQGIGDDALEDTIQILTEQGYLDDTRFVRLFAQDKRALEQWGSDRIRRTLIDRGVDRELIDAVLGHHPPESELDRALELLACRCHSPPRNRRERDRALGILLRKGYDPELALEALGAFSRGRESAAASNDPEP